MTIALARRAIAAPRWTWAKRIVTRSGFRIGGRQNGTLMRQRLHGKVTTADDHLPDFDDPETLAALRDMVPGSKLSDSLETLVTALEALL